MDFEILASQDVFTGKVFTVRRNRIRYQDGRQTDFDLILHAGAVTIVPLDDQQRCWFVRQYRHAAAKVILELPAGTLEPDEEPAACAAREIREEIGYAARDFQLLGSFFLAPGYSSEFMHVYLATGLIPDPLPSDDDEFLQPLSYPLEEVWKMLDQGEFDDAKTIAALSMTRSALARRP